MKKIILIISLIVPVVLCLGQQGTFTPPRSSPVITVQDSRYRALLNFYQTHTHGINMNGGLDSLGMTFYEDSSGHIFYRDTIPSGGHKWSYLLKNGDAGIGTVTQVNTGYGILGGPITGVGTLTADTAGLSNFWVRRRDSTVAFVTPTQMNAQGFLKTIAGITAGGDLTGTYPNPTISSNAVTFPKMQEIPGFSFIANPTASLANPTSSFFGFGLKWNNDSVKVDTTILKAIFGSTSPAGITQLNGDGTAGPGSGIQAFTLNTVNGNVYGTNTFLKFATNGKGLTTAATPVISSDITGVLGFTPIPLTALSATSPIVYNNTTGVISCPTCGVSGGGITTLNGLTAANQTFAIGYSGTSFNISSVTSTHTFNIPLVNGSDSGLVTPALYNTWNAKINISSLSASSPLSYNSGTGAFSIQQGNTSQNGYISSTDWNTFNGKQNALSGTGYILQAVSSSSYVSGSATNLIGYNASGTGSTIVLGTNLSMTGNTLNATGGGVSGTVTSFSAGTLSPLFTTSVANPTTTPALTFSLSNAAGNSVFGNSSGSSGAPSYFVPNSTTIDTWFGSTLQSFGNDTTAGADTTTWSPSANQRLAKRLQLYSSDGSIFVTDQTTQHANIYNLQTAVVQLFVSNFGALADELDLYDGASTAGSNILTSASASFVPTDTSKYISVTGAGGGGTRWVSTKIASVVDAHHVTLSTNASTTTVGQHIRYGTDNTTKLQNAINACSLSGCILNFRNGSYLVAGPLVHTDNIGGNPNAQLYLQITDPGFVGIDSFPKTVIFQGATNPGGTDGGLVVLNNGQSTLNHGTIIVSDLDSVAPGNDTASVIGSAFVNGASVGFTTLNSNLCTGVFRNLTVKVRHNGIRGAVMGAINMGWDINPEFHSVIATIDTALAASVQPSDDVTGITGMYCNQGGYCIFENTTSNGFFNGYKMGEHTVATNPIAYVNYNGIALMKNNAAIAIYSPETQWNRNNFAIVPDKCVGFGQVNANITNWRMEDFRVGGKWYQNIYDINDSTNQLYATVSYSKFLSSSGSPVYSIDLAGPNQNLHTTPFVVKNNPIEIQAPPGTNYPGSQAVNFNPYALYPRVGSELYITAAQASTGDSAYAAFVGGTMQNGTFHLLGTFGMINTALGGDQRSYMKHILTGASTNTAYANELFHVAGVPTLSTTVSGTLYQHFTPVDFAAPTTSLPSTNYAAGTWETSPADGDMGHVSGHLWFHDGSTDYDLLHPSGGSQTWQQTLTTGSTLNTTNTVTNTGQSFTWANGGTGAFKFTGLRTDTANTLGVYTYGPDSSVRRLSLANLAAELPPFNLFAVNGTTVLGSSNDSIGLGGSLYQNTTVGSGGKLLTWGSNGSPFTSFNIYADTLNFNIGSGGWMTFNGVFNELATTTTTTDANYTSSGDNEIILNTAITAGRTITLPTASNTGVVGRPITIINRNTSAFGWTYATTVLDASGNTISAIPNGTVMMIQSDGTNWRFLNSYISTGNQLRVTNDLTSQTAAATILSYSAPGSGSFNTYRVGGYVTVNSVSLDVIQLQVTWTDETNASRTQVFYPVGSTTPGLSATGANGFPTVDIRVKQGTTITVSGTLTTGTGSINWDGGSSIVQID